MITEVHEQGRLNNGWALGEGCVAVNGKVWFRDVDGVRSVFIGGTPFHTYDLSDSVQHRYCAAQLVESNVAKLCEVVEAFGIQTRSLQRVRRKLREEGIAGLVPKKKGPRGRTKAGGAVARRIIKLAGQGISNVQIGARLGVCEGTVRSVLKEHGIHPRAEQPEPRLPSLEAVETPRSEPADTQIISPAVDDDVESPAVDDDVESPAVDVNVACPAADDDVECAAADNTVACPAVDDDVESPAADDDVEATSIPYASDADQLAAMLGFIEEAPVEFQPARQVPSAGVLLGMALLSSAGLMEGARQVYGKLNNAWYGLRPVLWTLFVMALLRIKRPEQLKGADPAGLGRVLGLPRAPEVKTIRRKLAELSERGRAADLHRWLARRRAQDHDDALGYLYVDGHVRAYNGKHKIGKAYVTARKSVMRAETDYWVNLSNGQPLLVVHAEADEALTQIMPEILREVRAVIGPRRAMIVFDRGGWSKDVFRLILEEGFDLLTYRKEPLSDWPDSRFQEHEATIDGHTIKYDLADGEFQQRDWPRLRCLAVKRKDGRQTQILCSRYDIDAAVLAYRMFGRWQQENWFKYMGEQFALDVLVDYATRPDDPDRQVINPAWRQADKKVKQARAALEKARAVYGDSSLSQRPAAVLAALAAEVEEAERAYEEQQQRRRETPRQARLGDVDDRDPVKLSYESKLLTDTVKMCAYDVETQLTEMLEGVLCRNEFEGRAVVREIMQTPGDLTLDGGVLHVHLEQLSAPRYTKALMSLCEQLNSLDPSPPETSFRLRFHVKPRPVT